MIISIGASVVWGQERIEPSDIITLMTHSTLIIIEVCKAMIVCIGGLCYELVIHQAYSHLVVAHLRNGLAVAHEILVLVLAVSLN